jgi:hypothetical protein
MAGTEVIYFLFSAQLNSRPFFPALLPPKPVSEPPPELTQRLCLSGLARRFDLVAIGVS